MGKREALKQWLQRQLKQPTEPPKILSHEDYKTVLSTLLDRVEQGADGAAVQDFLQQQGMSPEQLAQWMTRVGGDWVLQPDSQFGKRLLALQAAAAGELAVIAGTLGREIVRRVSGQRDAGKIDPPPASAPLEINDEHQTNPEQTTALAESALHAADIAQLDETLALHPDNDAVWYERGVALEKLGRYEEAVKSFEQASQIKAQKLNLNVSNHQDSPETWFERGNALFNSGRFEAAIASYDQALKFKPDSHEAWVNRGNALAGARRIREAIASWEQALNINLDSYEAWFNHGCALYLLGFLEKAIASWEQALKAKPNSHDAWNNCGYALYQSGRLEEALASCDQALGFKPDHHEALLNRGLVLGQLGRLEEEITSYGQVLESKPNSHQAWYNRGVVLYKLGRLGEAIVSYEKALGFKPDYHEAWFNHGLALSQLGRLEEAINSYDRALKVKPDKHEAWTSRGAAFSKLGRWEQAIASYNQALKIKPDSCNAWHARSHALESFDRWEEAIANFDQALKVKPDFHVAWVCRGWAVQNSPGYSAQVEQDFVSCFIFEVVGAAQTALASFTELDDASAEPLPTALKAFVEAPLSPEVIQQLSQDVLQHPARQHPDTLNQRGYQGALNSYKAELGETQQETPEKAICQDTHPEGWGLLHQAIAKTHYKEGLHRPNASDYWRQAQRHFKRALETLQPPAFEELHIQVLQQLIQVLLDLGEQQEAQVLQQQGRALITRWLEDPDRSDAEKQKWGLKFGQFTQLTVDLAIRSGDIPQALQQAEFAKNVCLRWLLGVEDVSAVAFTDMQALLTPGTAVIYWHLSPAAITTFLLLPGTPTPILIPPPATPTAENPEAAEGYQSPQLQQRLHWERWLTQWNTQYGSYCAVKENDDQRRTHPWRQELSQSLYELEQLLNIAAIHPYLEAHTIQTLTLIPHRDLHRLPLHSFFAAYPCRYLPSAQVGLRQCPQTREQPWQQLLMVENPKSAAGKHAAKKLAELPFAEVEAAWVRELFRQSCAAPNAAITTLERQQANKQELVTALQHPAHHPAQVMHFTGHGAYNSTQPAQSCLFLAEEDRLTLLDIVGLRDREEKRALSSYQLVCLAACETAVTGNHTITDEYVGLTSAFLQAGVAQVVSTLWRVKSAATMTFMSQFYTAALSGQPPAVALLTAQTFLKTATYAQVIAALEAGKQLIESSQHPQAALLGLALEDELSRLQAALQEAVRNSDSECPYSAPYYWAAFTLSGF